LNLLFAWIGLPESKRRDAADAPGSRPTPKGSVWSGVWSVLRRPGDRISRLTLIYASGMFGLSAMSSVLALYLGARFGFTERTIGLVFLYLGIFAVVMRSGLVGPIVDRIGETRAMRWGAALLIAGLIGYPLSPNLWVLAAVVPLVPIGQALLFPATTSLMSSAAKKAEIGATMGIAQTFAGLSRLIAPVASTALFQYAGHSAPFLFAALSIALASFLTRDLEGRELSLADGGTGG
jgi:predicted MFS family arabinose efflux permease